MKTRFAGRLVAAVAMWMGGVAAARAEGLIRTLPADGTWARFEAQGEGVGPDGKIAVTLKGTLTIKSVGAEQVEGVDCRWIEIVTDMEFDRAGRSKGKLVDTLKLLIPEKAFAPGENPRAHFRKAWRKRDGQPAVEIDLKAVAPPDGDGLDELFHEPLAKSETKVGVEVEVPGGKFTAAEISASQTSKNGDIEMTTRTLATEKVPFGVAEYHVGKSRKRDNKPAGERRTTLKFAATGTDAKSAITPGQ